MAGAGPSNTEMCRACPVRLIAVDIGERCGQQPVRLRADLVRGPVVEIADFYRTMEAGSGIQPL